MLRTVGRWTVTLALVVSALVALYFVAAILFRRWASVLLACYLTGALGSLALTVYIRRQTLKNDFELMVWSAVGAATLQRTGIINRSRSRFAGFLSKICAFLTWPVAYLSGAIRSARQKEALRAREAILLRQLGADDLVFEPTLMLVSIGVAGGLALVSEQPRGPFIVFAWIAIAYVVCLCLSMILLPGALAQRVRRGSGAPFLKALAVAALTLCIAVFAFTIIATNGRPSVQAVVDTGMSLYSQFDSIKDLLSGRDVSTLTLAQGSVGALLVSATIQGLLSLKDFERTDEDLIVIAQTKALLGRPSAALTTLESIKSHNSVSLSLQAACFVGVEQLDRALDAIRRSNAIVSTATEQSKETELRTLLQAVSSFPFSENAFVHLYERWLTETPSLEWLVNVSFVLVNTGRASATRFLASLKARPNGADPVLAARLSLLSKDLEQARRYAEQTLSTTGALEFTRAANQILIGIAGPTSRSEDAEFFKTWCDEHLPSLLSLEPHIDTYERALLAMDGILMLRGMASEFGSAHQETLQFALNSLSARLRATAPDRAMADAMLHHMVPRAFQRQQI